ncbi:hypothetical protein SAMN05192529_11521 [Arachidicoccus rhizosphaerae]|uniref:Uncharacterized protein n=1 Tax=Arachidicoccus rhizosphaerae TaxID=551991 RepID=A0A1H4AJ75_9BACT|nr:hypothetical protein SAMN05192529_11521 [Arachidicoccus rhizosphaerae]
MLLFITYFKLVDYDLLSSFVFSHLIIYISFCMGRIGLCEEIIEYHMNDCNV